eukprot:jgi/Phyca11/577802/estExt2_Genewise1.C_PHYCAscaffold_4740001
MVELSLQCAIVGQIGSSFDVEIDDGKKVNKLKEMIQVKNRETIKCDAEDLRLFLAKKGNAWLPDDDPAAQDLEEGKVHTAIQALIDGEKMKEARTIADVLDDNNMTGEERAPKSRQIHVLVVVPQQWTVKRVTKPDDDLSRAKRARIVRLEVAYQGPVPTDFYSVPAETIDTYQQLKEAFLSHERLVRPLCLLYGPRRFGKTTIGHRLVSLLDAEPSILVIYCSLTPLSVESEEAFWVALGEFIGEHTRSFQEF